MWGAAGLIVISCRLIYSCCRTEPQNYMDVHCVHFQAVLAIHCASQVAVLVLFYSLYWIYLSCSLMHLVGEHDYTATWCDEVLKDSDDVCRPLPPPYTHTHGTTQPISFSPTICRELLTNKLCESSTLLTQVIICSVVRSNRKSPQLQSKFLTCRPRSYSCVSNILQDFSYDCHQIWLHKAETG